MNALFEAAWLRIHELLKVFAVRIAALDPTLIQSLGRSENSAFPLRAYLAFKRSADGEEISITIDMHSAGDQLRIDSDLCFESGEVIAIGPAAEMSLSTSQSTFEVELEDWLRAFERFLGEVEAATVEAASRLS